MQMTQLRLDELLGVVKDCYTSIDIRAILVKDQGQWTCLTLKVRLTSESAAELEEKYKRKRDDLGVLEKENITILCECRGIDSLDALLKEIQSNSVTLSIGKAKLLSTDQGILNHEAQEDDQFSNPAERSGFPYQFLSNPMAMSPRSYLHEKGIEHNEIGRDPALLKHFLDMVSNDSPINVILAFPVYCKEIPVEPGEKKTILCKYKIHKSLLPKLTGSIEIVTGDAASFKPLDLTPNEIEKEMCEVRVPMPSSTIGPNTRVNVEIRNDKLELVASHTFGAEQLREVLRPDDDLIAVFNLFQAAGKIEAGLAAVKETPQMAASISVLSLLGFRCIPLGLVEKSGEKLIDAGPEVGSADTLAYHPEIKSVLVIDNTNGVPDTQKVAHIHNTCDHISKKLKINTMPTIISTKDSTPVEKEAKSLRVLLLDDECMKLLSHYALLGQRDAGISLLQGYITNAMRGIPSF